MKLSVDHGTAQYRITAWTPGTISINGAPYENSLLLTPWHLEPDWPVPHIDQFDEQALEPIRALEPELILLGTGRTQRFPRRSVLVDLLRSGIGVEVMDTGAACRTFNVVMAEDRRVVAALLPG